MSEAHTYTLDDCRRLGSTHAAYNWCPYPYGDTTSSGGRTYWDEAHIRAYFEGYYSTSRTGCPVGLEGQALADAVQVAYLHYMTTIYGTGWPDKLHVRCWHFVSSPRFPWLRLFFNVPAQQYTIECDDFVLEIFAVANPSEKDAVEKRASDRAAELVADLAAMTKRLAALCKTKDVA